MSLLELVLGKRKARVEANDTGHGSPITEEDLTMLFDKSKSRETETAPHLEHGPSFKKRLGWWVKEGHAPMVLEITPAMAEAMLEYNDRNRPLSAGRVTKYADEMKAGRWCFTGETIAFSRSRLSNGQHRLQAIIASGVTVSCLVVFGVPENAFELTDQHGKRTAGDIFSIHGVPQAPLIAAMTNIVIGYDDGSIRNALTSARKPPPDRLYQQFCALPRLLDSRWVGDLLRATPGFMPPALGAACHYICARFNRAKADEFFRSFIEGTGLKKLDPAYKLRDRLLRNANDGNDRMSRRAMTAITIKAWNAFRDGRLDPKLSLRWNDDESFPKAH